MKHETIKDCLLIARNMNAWTDSNKEEILDTAILKYLEKCYATKKAVVCLASLKVNQVLISTDEEKQQTDDGNTCESN